MMKPLLFLGLGTLLANAAPTIQAVAAPAPVDYQVVLDVAHRGYDGQYCWVHARAGIVPRGPDRFPSVVLTMQRLWLRGSDVFYGLNEMRTDTLSRTWTGPYEHADTLGRRTEADGVVVAISDYWPKWHAASSKLLGIGHTVRYTNNQVDLTQPRQTAYAVYDPAQRNWTAWKTLSLPNEDRFFNSGAGSVQRYDLPNGEILLPVYGRGRGQMEQAYRVTVFRCRFDGENLSVVDMGNDLHQTSGRGFTEPSLTRFGDRYFLTLRNDHAGYVTVSDDGLHFAPPQRWTWDDGTELGNYNTQQHWVTHQDGLFLVYTRKGASNDHVFRHRAPLFMAQVDPQSLTVIRATERILVPDRGARLGNFGVTEVSPDETWVTVSEWMQTHRPQLIIPVDNARGADNSVYAARIMWKTPNQLHRR